jgi:energy-coupling factor transport system ATP-binding protein
LDLKILGIPPDGNKKRVDEALESVEMTEYKKHAPHLLSGGQKQRVAIAGILAMNQNVYIR